MISSASKTTLVAEMSINNSEILSTTWKARLSLRSDAWKVSPVKDGHNAWRNNPGAIKVFTPPLEIPATVPGSIHTDLIAAGIIKDISIDGKEQDQFWIWKTDTEYTTTIKQDSRPGNKTLVFYGLDTICTIYVNGNEKLKTKNMHRSYRLDLTTELTAGDVEIRVAFKAPLTDAEDEIAKVGNFYARPYEMPYNYQRKMACSYGWDWGPITVSSGIWKKVEIQHWNDAYLHDCSITTTVENGVPSVNYQVRVGGVYKDKSIRVSISDTSGTPIFHEEHSLLSGNLRAIRDIPLAELWHPRGRGEQKLYIVSFELVDSKGSIVEGKSKRIGFRRVELDTSLVAKEISGKDAKHMFAIKVNGERLWIRGANWIPDDPFPTRVTKERYRQRINDMLEVNINGIRVWGGGLYESDDFYDLCDEEGIVVWQDFLFACAAYPETKEMFEEVAAEVDENVRRLSSHPSLVIWCGGNECIEGYQYWGWKEQLQDTPWGETFYRRTIPGILADLDQSRPYIPGSPIATHSEDVKNFDSGTNHIWDVWNELGYERYEQYSPSFAAEFGFNGPGSWSMLTRAIGSDDLDSRTPEVAYHQRAFDGMTKIANGLKREFAEPPVSGHAWYFAAALDQARAVEIGLKHFRSLYETCSGSILWQFNDMWPAISWAVLDYTGFRKLAWHAMKAAYRPRTICVGRVDQGAQVTIINDLAQPWSCDVDVALVSASGDIVRTHKIKLTIPPYGVSRTAMTDHFTEIQKGDYEGFIVATSDECRAARRSSLQPAKAAPQHELTVTTEFKGDSLQVVVKANKYLHEISLLSEIAGIGTQVDSQMAYLFPGETHTFNVKGPREVLTQVQARIDELLWTHNRVVNG